LPCGPERFGANISNLSKSRVPVKQRIHPNQA
jgi:hypothetical protein